VAVIKGQDARVVKVSSDLQAQAQRSLGQRFPNVRLSQKAIMDIVISEWLTGTGISVVAGKGETPIEKQKNYKENIKKNR